MMVVFLRKFVNNCVWPPRKVRLRKMMTQPINLNPCGIRALQNTSYLSYKNYGNKAAPRELYHILLYTMSRVSKSCNHAITLLRKIFGNLRTFWTSESKIVNFMYLLQINQSVL